MVTVRRVLFGVCALLLGSAPAWAEILTVQGGEHADFTRLVIPIGPARDWQLETDGTESRLALTPDVTGFDLRESFDLIPRTRIATMTAEGATLSIRLACQCAVTAFRFRDRFLVIDVSNDSDGDSTANSDVPQDVPDTNAEDALRQQQRRAAANALPDLTQVLTGGPSILARGTPTEAPNDAPATSMDAPPSVSPEVTTNLEQAAQIMAEQLARAAAAGLIRPAQDLPLQDAAEPTLAPSPDTSPVSPNAPPAATSTTPDRPRLSDPDMAAEGAPPATQGGPPIVAQNAFDIPRDARPDTTPPAPLLSCTAPTATIATWQADEDFINGLSTLRLTLFDERDRINDHAAVALAQHYLAFGFGAEARFWLSQTATPQTELIALSDLIESIAREQQRPNAAPPQTTEICGDEAVLLHYLGGHLAVPVSGIDADRIQRAFATLPSALHSLLGPTLARALHIDGHGNEARNIRDALHRANRLSQAVLLSLDLDLGVGVDPDAARQTLEVALRDDGADPAPTMTHALALDRTAQRATAQYRVTAAAALSRETPPGPQADALWRERVAAEARLGQIDGAIALLDQGRRAHAGTWQTAVTDIIEDRVRQEDGASLLVMAHLFGADWVDSGTRAGRARVAAARQLRAAGFTAAADRLLENGSGLILPAATARDLTTASRPETETGTIPTVADLAAQSDTPEDALAARMLQRDRTPEAVPLESRAIDLTELADTIADSATLRQTVNAVLNAGPTDATP